MLGGAITREEFFERRRKPKRAQKGGAAHPRPGPPFGGVWVGIGQPTNLDGVVHVRDARAARKLIASESSTPWMRIIPKRGVLNRFGIAITLHQDSMAPSYSRTPPLAFSFRGQRDPATILARSRFGGESSPIAGSRTGEWWSFALHRTLKPPKSENPRKTAKPAKLGISVGPDGTVLASREKGPTMRAVTVSEAVSRLLGFVCEARIVVEGSKRHQLQHLVWSYVLTNGRRTRHVMPEGQQIPLLGVA